MAHINLGVLVSGGGTNLQAIIDSIEEGKIKGEISIVISSNEKAYALKRAEIHGIPNIFIDSKNFKNQIEYEEHIVRILKAYDIDLVLLAGFMKVLSPVFISEFRNKIMNIHPALIPAFSGKGFYGSRVHKAVIEYGVKISGATVHFVDEGTDTGPIIIQEVVPVLDDDTVDSLAERVLEVEHKIFPEAVKLFSENRLLIRGRKVLICE
ncbi:MAG TPA: phosphoribosylglycinamide formyltransferase [Thermoanaerobacterales bacterium]|nr:phosphoribosylglycinamide formyltransferase [Thermoanaerobacterales bacterium]